MGHPVTRLVDDEVACEQSARVAAVSAVHYTGRQWLRSLSCNLNVFMKFKIDVCGNNFIKLLY